MSEFIFNKYGVCVNPERIVVCDNSQFFIEITLAYNHQWFCGFRIEHKPTSCGKIVPCSDHFIGITSRETIISKVVSALRNLINQMIESPYKPLTDAIAKRTLNDLELLEQKQMELF